jgi:hypothetical protein
MRLTRMVGNANVSPVANVSSLLKNTPGEGTGPTKSMVSNDIVYRKF